MNKKAVGKTSSKEACNDKNCPFHGKLRYGGETFIGTVISTKMHKTAIVEWLWKKSMPKYERYESKRTKVKAHNPLCINAQEGDIVKIIRCRPLSKTKNFVIVEISGKEKGFKEKIEAREEAKVKKEVKEEEKEEEAKGKMREEKLEEVK